MLPGSLGRDKSDGREFEVLNQMGESSMFGKEKGKNNVAKIGGCAHDRTALVDDILRCVDCGKEFDKKDMGPDLPGVAEVTEGQYLVGIDFNPGGNPAVTEVKKRTADLIDDMIGIINAGENEGAMRCAAVALSKYEEAGMWAVKAITKPPMPVMPEEK